jgi:hypothetical protein
MTTVEQIAREIVEAEMADNWFLADLLWSRLRAVNRARRALGLRPIRATQAWYFDEQRRDTRAA